MAPSEAATRGETCRSISPSSGRTFGASGKFIRLEVRKALLFRPSPAELTFYFVHVRQIIKEKVRLIFRQSLAGPRTGRDRDRPRPESFATGDVVSGVAHDVHLFRTKIEARMCRGASNGARTERITIVMIVGEGAERKEMPKIIMPELQLRAAFQISGEQSQRLIRLPRQVFQ